MRSLKTRGKFYSYGYNRNEKFIKEDKTGRLSRKVFTFSPCALSGGSLLLRQHPVMSLRFMFAYSAQRKIRFVNHFNNYLTIGAGAEY